MRDINLEEATIRVDGKWFTSEEIADAIQRKIQAGDMKISDYAAALEKRLFSSRENGPLIKSLNDSELSQYISTTLGEREEYYLMSKGVVEGLSLDLKQLFSLLESEGLYNP